MNTNPSMIDVIKLSEQARILAKTDLSSAIEMLNQLRNHPSFFPYGALNLLNLLVLAQQLLNARVLSDEFAEKMPAFAHVWYYQIGFSCGTDNYYNVIKRISLEILKKKKLTAPWMLHTYLQVLISGDPENIESFFAPYLAGSLLSIELQNAIKILINFFNKIRSFIQMREQSPAAWSFAFLGTEEICREFPENSNIFYINISPLSRSLFNNPISLEIKSVLASPIKIAASAIMNWAPFIKEDGIYSLPNITEIDRYTVIFWHLLTSPLLKFKTCAIKINHKHAKSAQVNPGELWVRAGNVELWALWSYLDNRSLTLSAAEQVAIKLFAAPSNHDIYARTRFWPNMDAVFNIKRLSTNAGWYAKPNYAALAFTDWAERYLAALSRGNLIAGFAEYLIRNVALAPSLRINLCRFNTFKTISEMTFLSLLNNAKVVFVTAFANEIAEHYINGQLDKLWSELNVKVKLNSLRTIKAPMSIWPNYPLDHWSASFNQLEQNCINAINETDANLFIAACGCYGLPIVDAMNKRFNITSIYNGHQSNLYFGVFTKAFRKNLFYQDGLNSQHWIRVNLGERYPSLLQVDQGRYANEK